MALLFVRATAGCRTQLSKNSQNVLFKRILNEDQGYKVCAASLISLQGEKAVRKKPFPHENFRFWHIFMDHCLSRFDQNSKIIVIDGNIATGKTELGKKIAKEFDMHYVPDSTDSDYFKFGDNKVDIREFDDQLPIGAQSCDFERFYLQNGPKKRLASFPRTQYNLFREKVNNYAYNVLRHLFNTGQGVVMNRGMWSDLVWAHALGQNGYMSRQGVKQYMYQYQILTIKWLWYPHLVIYLDAAPKTIKENIKKRNVFWEVNSPVLTDKFLNSINEAYKNEYLPRMRPFSEILTYDITEDPLDFDIVVEDLEKLNLRLPTPDNPKRFIQWITHHRNYNTLRSICSPMKRHRIDNMYNFHPPYDAPELLLQGDDMNAFRDIVLKDPRIWYRKEPDNWSRYFRLL